MSDRLLRLFLIELEHQCNFALMAYQDSRKSLECKDNTLARTWLSIHSLLLAAGNISKILWPSDNSASRRRSVLREKLGVSDQSPLKDRRMRNHFEHYDERLEEWGKENAGGMFLDSNIGSLGVNRVGGTRFRHFDPKGFVVSFGDEKYELEKIVTAVEELQERTSKAREQRV